MFIPTTQPLHHSFEVLIVPVTIGGLFTKP